MNTYRVLLPVLVNGEHGQGDIFEHEFTADDEATNLQSGLIEIVPRRYKVVGASIVHATEPGGTFSAAFTIGQEAALMEAGHIERVETKASTTPKPEKAKPPATTTETKE